MATINIGAANADDAFYRCGQRWEQHGVLVSQFLC
jgi:hypothetical protein